ncbi:hypothetical protein CDAR_501071 [Caerostris darwini]|uniref:Uncharacterized protein n=1 Tax=Caerostris darwini TaxID=1538125 RepID=A0AAV4PPQ3_9ARAC|nr:hypothetical protein CDAR_501071 [Caerostris darwini]
MCKYTIGYGRRDVVYRLLRTVHCRARGTNFHSPTNQATCNIRLKSQSKTSLLTVGPLRRNYRGMMSRLSKKMVASIVFAFDFEVRTFCRRLLFRLDRSAIWRFVETSSPVTMFCKTIDHSLQ